MKKKFKFIEQLCTKLYIQVAGICMHCASMNLNQAKRGTVLLSASRNDYCVDRRESLTSILRTVLRIVLNIISTVSSFSIIWRRSIVLHRKNGIFFSLDGFSFRMVAWWFYFPKFMHRIDEQENLTILIDEQLCGKSIGKWINKANEGNPFSRNSNFWISLNRINIHWSAYG